MKSFKSIQLILFLSASQLAWSQHDIAPKSNRVATASNSEGTRGQDENIIRITGVRFAYPLIQHWIDNFNKEYPDVQVIIESRGTTDPSRYDMLIEAYEQPQDMRNNHEQIYIARYAVLPVANAASQFAEVYGQKGLDKDLIVQLFFHNLYIDPENKSIVKAPYTVYTRLQKAGAASVFAKYFGFDQKDIDGKVIAGADEHLLKAVLRDSNAISYLPLPLIYDRSTKNVTHGIAIVPVDLDGDGKVNSDEKFYSELTTVLQRFEEAVPADLYNLPVEHLRLSVDKRSVSAELLTFLSWITKNGEKDLHDFGYLKPQPSALEKNRF